jgi:hypothetical protein
MWLSLLLLLFASLPIALSKGRTRPHGGSHVAGGIRRMPWGKGARFIETLVREQRPVILTDTPASELPAMAKWTPEYLEAELGNAKMKFMESSSKEFLWYDDSFADSDWTSPSESTMLTIRDFRRAVEQGRSLYYSKYLTQEDDDGNEIWWRVLSDFPQQRAFYSTRVKPLLDMMSEEPPNIWLGAPGVGSELHYDNVNNVYLQVSAWAEILVTLLSD